MIDPRAALIEAEPRIVTLGFLDAPVDDIAASLSTLCDDANLRASGHRSASTTLTTTVETLLSGDQNALNAALLPTTSNRWTALVVNPDRLFDLGGVLGLLTKVNRWQALQVTHVDRRWDLGHDAAPEQVACEYQHVYPDGAGRVFPRVVGWRMVSDGALDFYEIGVRRSYEHLASYARERVDHRLQRQHLEVYAQQNGIEFTSPSFYQGPATIQTFHRT